MAAQTTKDKSIAKKHHQQSSFCYKRPAYREARWERAVKVYTINQESKYLVVQGVPSVGVTKELVELFAIYGPIEEYRCLHEYPGEEFTDVYWIKFQKIQAARYAKKKLDMRSFYGGILHVCYAPEFESVDDTREKLNERRRVVARKCRELYPETASNSDQNLTEKCSEAKSNTSTTSHPSISASESTKSTQLPPSYSNDASQYRQYESIPLQEPQFPQLPLPPINLPPFLYPPPPPPPSSDYPRVPSKDATLPLHLRNATYSGNENGNETRKRTAQSTTGGTHQTAQDVMQCSSSGTKRQLVDQSPTPLDQPKRSEKRIVWRSSPGASTSCMTHPEPGAWDPFAESRKNVKSLTGDQNLDEVAMNIREKLRKVTEIHACNEDTVQSNIEDVDLKSSSTVTREDYAPKKKTRKRI